MNSLKGIVAFGVSNKVKSMAYMFEYCHHQEDISSLAGWDVSGVTNMERMFWDCSGLVDASGLSDWDVSNMEISITMFKGCKSLKEYPAWYGH